MREQAKWGCNAPMRTGTVSGGGFSDTFPSPGTYEGEVT